MTTYFRNKRPIKICFFPGDLNPGGIAHLMINLAKELVDRNIEVHFFLTKRKGSIEGELPAEIRVFRRGSSVKGTLLGLIQYIRQEKPVAIVSARDSLNAVNVLACKLSFTATKAITSVHVDFSNDNPARTAKGKIHRWSGLTLGRLLYRFSNEIIAVSNGVADNLAKRMYLDRRKITVIYNPTFQMYNEVGTVADAFLEHFQKPVLIGVGRLTAQKGFDTLIQAFSFFKEKHKSGTLLILGEGEDREKLEAYAKELEIQDCVIMPGYLKRPAQYIKKADLFVFTSRWEGFGNVLVEALGVGAKIVSTDCKSGPAEILDNEKYGTLVPVDDPHALLKAIEMQLNKSIDKEMQISRAKDFSVDKIADKYLELILKGEVLKA